MDYFNQFMGSFNINMPARSAMFSDTFSCYPSVYINSERQRIEIEEGNKILLPPSTLQILTNQNVGYPMIFKIQNTVFDRSTHVGVLEFTAQEGQCIIPTWMFNNLYLEQGNQVIISLANKIPKGNFVKIRPHQTEFIEMQNPKAFLEIKLRKFTCLTVGDTIDLKLIQNKTFQVDILEVRPNQNNINCICVIEADVEVDFAEPLDYDEHMQKQQQQKQNEQQITYQQQSINLPNKTTFLGGAVRIDGKTIKQDQINKAQQIDQQKNQQAIFDPRKHRIKNGIKGQSNINIFQGRGTKIL